MSYLKQGTSFFINSIILLSLTGCATTNVYHTTQESDERLMSHFYNADFDTVMNGTVEAAASVTNWTVDSTEPEKGFVNVKDQTTWGTYIRKIKVEKMSETRMKVNVLTYASLGGNYRGPDKEQ